MLLVKTVTVYDEKCICQAIYTHDRTVTRWAEPSSGYRVRECL